ADELSLERCTDRLEAVYAGLTESAAGVASASPGGRRRTRGGGGRGGGVGGGGGDEGVVENAWTRTLRLVEREWDLWEGRTEAAWESLRPGGAGEQAGR
ncbi:MAG: hypothetical protein WD009_08520, partial [Phycisphaeraceae bacterium]